MAKPEDGGHGCDVEGAVGIGGGDEDDGGAPVEDCGGDVDVGGLRRIRHDIACFKYD